MNGPVRMLAAAVAWMAACALVFVPGFGGPALALVGIGDGGGDASTGALELPADPLTAAVFTSHGYPTASLLDAADLPGGLFDPAVGPGTTARPTLTDVLADLEGDTPTLTGAVAIPDIALAAYKGAEARAAQLFPGCYVPWQVLAGIGKVESGHGTYAGADAVIDDDGTVKKSILGPRLIGGEGISEILDTDGGRLDGDRTYDRAVGPLQFIPTSWAAYGQDANGDNVRDPNNFHDAALSAVAHLCDTSPGDYRTDTTALAQALYAYNRSPVYVSTVLSWINTYRGIGTADSPVPSLPPLSPAPEYTPPPSTPPAKRPTSVPPANDPPRVAQRDPAPAPTYQGPPAATPSPKDKTADDPTPTPTTGPSPTPSIEPPPGPSCVAADPTGSGTEPTAAPTGTPTPSSSADPDATPTTDSTQPCPDPTGSPSPTPAPSDTPTDGVTDVPTEDLDGEPTPTPGAPTPTPSDTPSPDPDPDGDDPGPAPAPAPSPSPRGAPAPQETPVDEPGADGPSSDPTDDVTDEPAVEDPTPEPEATNEADEPASEMPDADEPSASPTVEAWTPPDARYSVEGDDSAHTADLQVSAVAAWLDALMTAVNTGDRATAGALLDGLADPAGTAGELIADVDAAGPVTADLVELRYEAVEEPVGVSVRVWRVAPDGAADEAAEPWLAAELIADGNDATLSTLEVR